MSNSSYDTVPYESNAFPQSQPEQLGVIARLFGLTPQLPSRARVLELGCSAGGNLIPLAARYPEANFRGMDLSAAQVERARATIAALGLRNVDVRQQSIVATEKAREPFDYIICHGVYSWVTPDVQEAILRVCRENLSEHGVAYISYNTYPGWKMREVVRDVMMYHAQSLDDPKQKLEQARAILKFTEEVSDANTAFGKMLREETAVVAKAPDYYLFHDHLEAENRPCYFRDFIERARRHELSFLGEASLGDMAPQRFGEKIYNAVQKLSNNNILATEQYMDFFRNRSFRQTLLVHAAAMPRVKRNISPEVLRQFLLTSSFLPTRAAVPETGEELEFRNPGGRSIKTVVPLIKAMLMSLARAFPHTLGYDDWVRSVRASLEGKIHLTDNDQRTLDDHFLRFVIEGVIQLHLEAPTLGSAQAAQPRAFAPARLAAQHAARRVTSLRHESIGLNQVETKLLAMLDGAATHEQLIQTMVERTAKREFTLMKDNIQLTDVQEIQPIVSKLLTDSLNKFEKLALLG